MLLTYLSEDFFGPLARSLARVLDQARCVRDATSVLLCRRLALF
jgi:hypothetical protein